MTGRCRVCGHDLDPALTAATRSRRHPTCGPVTVADRDELRDALALLVTALGARPPEATP